MFTAWRNLRKWLVGNPNTLRKGKRDRARRRSWYRPRLELLEGRIAPTLDHFVFIVPSAATAGVSFGMTVMAENASNVVDTAYAGTIHFTTTDGLASLPANSTLSGGTGIFSATLKTAGSQNLTATDTVTTGIVGTSSNIAVGAAAASSFTVSAPATALAGSPFTVSITALDQFHNTAASYSGTVHFTTTDGQATATLPANATLTNGVGTFSATLKTAGNQTLTAADITNVLINGTSNTINVNPGAITHFAVSAPSTVTAAAPFNLTVTAEDTFGNTAKGYAGTVTFTCSDKYYLTLIPYNSTLTAGVGQFSATLHTAGTQTLTATDSAIPGITGNTSVTVSAAAVTHFSVTAPTMDLAGVGFNMTVMAEDASNNIDAAYAGTVHFTASDVAASLPANATLSGGMGIFLVTLKTAGSQILTATDTVTPAITGSGTIAVTAAAATYFAVVVPSSTQAGAALTLTVTAKDQFGNAVPGYSGTVRFSSSDSQAALPFNATLTNGVGIFSATLKTAGNQIVTATDTANSGITGTGGPLTVGAGLATHFAVTAPSAVTAGVAFSITVAARDFFDNTATSYSGTTRFTSSDPAATLPPNTTLTAGAGVFSAIFHTTIQGTPGTPGSQTISATDTVVSSLTGTSPGISVQGLVVTSLTPTTTGFVAGFSKAFDPSQLNLYDAGVTPTYGPADVTLVDPSGVPIRGSLVIDTSNTIITFIKTAMSALTAGTYSVTFRSAVNGFKDLSGNLLDGNDDGVPGGNYQTSFVVVGAAPVVVGIPSFARGPDSADAINLPNNTTSGIPIELSNGSGVTSGIFTLQYNSALLNVTGVTVNSNLPGATLILDASSTPGNAVIDFASPTALASGIVRLGGLVATVPNSASSSYRDTAVLQFSSEQLNAGAINVTGVAAVEVAAYLGDATGDGQISAGDAALIGRVATNLDTGFAAYPLVDPVILGDVTSSGNVSSTDVALVNRVAAGIPAVQIPSTPGLSIPPNGPALTATVQVSIPTNLTAVSGGTVVVPVNINDPDPSGSGGLDGIVLAIDYAPGVFTVTGSDVQLGTLTTGWSLVTNVNSTLGQLGIALSTNNPLTSTASGSLVLVTFHVNAAAALGPSAINLAATNVPSTLPVTTRLDAADGQDPLLPAVTNSSNDPGVDGVVTIALQQFVITAPSATAAGAPFTFTVTAQGAGNVTATGYTGTVQFTATDGLGSLPANATLSGGMGIFLVTLKTAGSQILTATDTASASITGSGTITVTPAAATNYAVVGPTSTQAGAALTLTVTAKDQFGNTATGYVGTVHFTSTDPLTGSGFGLPADATLTGGVGIFSIKLKTAGNQLVTAADTVTSSITQTTSPITVNPAAATHFVISGAPSSTIAGAPIILTVTAEDAFNNVTTIYSGTVHFTSSDGQAVLPADSTLTSGVGAVSVTLKTAGNQTVTATDTVYTIAGNTSVTVSAVAATHFSVTAPAAATAGVALSFTVTALDASNNTAAGYTGTIHLTSTDNQAVLPADTTLVNGVGTFTATLNTAGNQTLTASDNVASITGTSATILVSTAKAPGNFSGPITSDTAFLTPNGTYVITGNLSVASLVTLTIGPNVTVDINNGATITDNGTLNISSGVAMVAAESGLFGAPALAGIVVDGIMNATGANFTITGSGGNSGLQVASGGHLLASNCTFAWSSLSLAAGSILNSGDITNNSFDKPITVPASDAALLASNLSFQAINILSGSISTGQPVTLAPLGTATTVNQQYVFSGMLTVPLGATLNISSGTAMVAAESGAFGAPALVGIVVDGIMNATGANFTITGSGGNSGLQVASGGHLLASNCTFAWSSLSLAAGSILNSGDITNNSFDKPITVPASDAALLASNLSFQAINILSGSISTGQPVTLAPLGTATTVNQQYVFSGMLTVPLGATLNISSGTAMVAAESGAFGAPALVGIVVDGIMNATGANFTITGSGGNSGLQVASGGHLTASNCTFAWSSLTLAAGSSDTIHSGIFDTPIAINSGATISISGNDFTNATVVASGNSNTTINLSNNYWGTTNTAQIAAKITTSGPIVQAQPFLTLAPASYLAISAPVATAAGNAFSITVTAINTLHNTALNYTGTVHFASTDGQAVLPADATLTNGVGIFSVTLKTAGSQTLTATDTGTGPAGVSGAIDVIPVATSQFAAVGIPASTIAGIAFSLTLTAQDQYGNTTPSYGGTVQLSSTDSIASLPGPNTLTGGSGIFSVVLTTAGSQQLRAVDIGTSAIAFTSGSIIVVPAQVSVALDPSSDSGAPNHDGLTNITNPVFDVTVNEAGTIRMDFTGNGTITAAIAVAAAGTYQFNAPVLANGTYSAIATFLSATAGVGAGSTTYTIDTAGPYVLSMNPNGAVGTTVAQVIIAFNKPINLATFTPSAITLIGPGGAVAVTQPTLVSGSTYAIGFVSPLASGSYTLTVAPSVESLAGNKMDQNRNGINGEPSDFFSGMFSVALPDLVVSSIAPPPNESSGSPVNVTLTIKNQGTAPTYSGWQDVVILSQVSTLADPKNYDGVNDANLFANPNTIVEALPNLSSLGVGQSYTQLNVQVPLPFSAPAGTWYVYVVTDGTGSQYPPHMVEASRIDKIAVSSPFTVTASPAAALQVSNVVAPDNDFSGQSINVTWKITNNGMAATSAAGWTDAVYMSTINSFDASATLLGTFAHNGILTVGGHYTNSQEVTLPLTMPGSSTVLLSGSFYFLVKTDINGAVVENGATAIIVAPTSTAKTISAASTPDLKVSNVTAPPPSVAGHDVSFTYTVVNHGPGGTPNSVWTDSYYLSPTATFNASTAASLGQQQFGAGLAVGADYSKTINAMIPYGLSGLFFVLVDTDSGGAVFEMAVDEPDKWGASAAFQVSNSPPDLVVSSLSAPATALAGSAVLLNWTVANQGAGTTAVGSWQDNVYADKNATLDANAVQLGTFTHNGVLNPGSSYTSSQLVTLPIGFLGAYNLFVITNATGAVAESNTTNNTSAPAPITVSLLLPPSVPQGTLQIAEVAGMQVVSVASSATAAPGANPTVSWTVVNNGPGTTDSNYWYDDVWISTNTTLGSGGTDVYLGTVEHVNPLAAGASYSASATLPVPQTVPAGSYYFIVTTDRPVPPPADPLHPTANQQGNLVYGGTTANKEAAASAPTQVLNPPAAVLAVTNITAPTAATSGQTLSVGWTVTNSGGNTGNVSITDSVYLSLDQVLDSSARCLGYTTFSGTLANGGSYTQQPTTFQLPAGLAGAFYVFVQTNSNNSVYELNTANNSAYNPTPVQITLPPLADLAVSAINIPATATAGQTMNVTYMVMNAVGSSPANGSWTDAVYLSTSPNGTANDVLLAQAPNPMSLGAGASYLVTNWPVQVPGLAPGFYYVLVRTNVLGNLPESPTANNLGASATTVAIDAQPLGTPTNGSPTSVTGTLTNGQSDYYKVVVSAGETLQFNFRHTTANAANAFNELYVSQGTMPTRGQYEFRFPSAGPDQQITVPLTQAGAYYVLAYGAASLPVGGEPYTLTASLVPFSIQAPIVPATVGAGQVTVEIDGAQFNASTTFQVVVPNNSPITAQAVQLQNSTVAYATFNLTGLPPGSYDIQASNGTTTTTLPLGLTVVAMGPPTLQTYLSVPDGVLPGPDGALPGHEGTVTVNYVNQGNTDAVAPLLQLSAKYADLELADQNVYTAEPVWFLGTSGTGPAGILRPGEGGQVTINFLTTGVDGQVIDFNLQAAADSQQIDWASQQAALQPATIPDAAWPAVFANFVSNVGPTVGSFHAALAADATDLSQLGQPTYDVLPLMSLEIAKADAAFPVQTPIANITDDTVGSLTFQRSFQQSTAGRYTLGMLGYGWTTNWDISASTDANGNVTIFNDGAVSYYALQANGSYQPAFGDSGVLTFANNAFQLVQANGTTIQFNPNGTLAYVQDTTGYTVTASYTVDGRLATLKDSNGETFAFSYSQGLLSQLTDSNSVTVSYGYTGQFLTTVTSNGSTTGYGYVSGMAPALNNALASITPPNSATITFTYNAEGLLTATSNGGPATVPGLPGLGGPPALPVIPFVLSASNTTPIVRPTDPNSIANPNGTGPASYFVGANQVLGYTIRFENKSTAGAPVREATITEQLDPSLDLSTFQLGAIILAGMQYPVALNSTESFALTDGYQLNVTAKLNPQTRVATWIFNTVESDDDETSNDLLIGALAPDNPNGDGEGSVSYVVTPNALTATNGTRINAQATVVFDTQSPEITDPVFNTIDAGLGLQSAVDPLPVDETLSTFEVSWSGTDANNGSAISDYTIYVRDNSIAGSSYTPWLQDTKLTSATYSGQDGHSYSFYSVAMDNAGNVQLTPAGAQASTVVEETIAHFDFSAPPTATAGSPFSCTVTALDGLGNTATAFSGTASLISTDANAVIPANLVFVNGVTTFTARLDTAGYQVLDALDPADGVPDSTDAVFVNAAPALDFDVTGPSTATAGISVGFTVTALDQFGNTISGYSGVVHLQSTDAFASLQANSTLTNGVGIFSAVLVKAGIQIVTAGDTVTKGLTGTSMPITVQAAAMAQFSIHVPRSSSAAGQTVGFSVTAADQFGNPVTGYNGTVHFRSNDPADALPADATLSNGVGVFAAVVTKAGSWTLTVNDNSNTSLAGTANAVTITPLAATRLGIIALGGAQAGEPVVLSVTALDQFGNVVGSGPNTYAGTFHFTSSDNRAQLQPSSTLSSGAGLFAAIFKTAGTETITATDTINTTIAGSAIVIVAAAPANHFGLAAPLNAIAGTPLTITVTAQDQFNNTVTNYAGTVHFTPVTTGGFVVPADYTCVPADNGQHVFTGGVTLVSGPSQTITATDATANITGSVTINVNAAAASHFVVNGPSTATAGSFFICMVTALDPFNNIAVHYPGTVHFTSSDAQAVLPANATLTNGIGYFAASLAKPGNQTITVTDTVTVSLSATSNSISVSAPAATHFVVSAAAPAIAGQPVTFTITAESQFNALVPTYSGTVHFTSSDPGAILPANSTLIAGMGTFSATLATPGNQTLSATDTLVGGLTGTSSTVLVHSLEVASVTPASTGFVATFNKPVNLSHLNLYDAVAAGNGPADVTLVGPAPSTTAVRGSLLTDPTGTTITFVKTASFTGSNFNPASGLLAAGTYTLTLRSASNGFVDTLGNLLDGNKDGIPGDNFVTTFVVAAGPVAVGVPSFARGPGNNVLLPNNAAAGALGIPLNLSSGVGVTSARFVLQYNPALLTISGVTVNSGLTGATMTLDPSSTAGNAVLIFSSPTALASGVVRLGALQATVPNSAASLYKSKALLHFASEQINGGAIAVIGDDAVQVDAYLGDTNGDGQLSGGDSALLSRVGVGSDSGFAAFPLLDPFILGDLTSVGSVEAADVTLLNSALAGTTHTQLPLIPAGLTITASGPDPALSVPTDLQAIPGNTVVVPVNIDTAKPLGSTGLTEAILALEYNPKVLSVTPADVQLGSLPNASSGWQLQTVVNAQAGQIGIDLFSLTPILTTSGGSLVTISLHVHDSAPVGSTGLSIVSQVNPSGQRSFQTTVSDSQGALVLHTAMTPAGEEPGAPGLVTVTGPLSSVGPGAFFVVPVAATSGPACTPVARPGVSGGGNARALGVVEQVFDDLEQLFAEESVFGQPGVILNSEFNGQAESSVSDQGLLQQVGVAQHDWVPADLVAYLGQTAKAGRHSPIGDLLDGWVVGQEGVDLVGLEEFFAGEDKGRPGSAN